MLNDLRKLQNRFERNIETKYENYRIICLFIVVLENTNRLKKLQKKIQDSENIYRVKCRRNNMHLGRQTNTSSGIYTEHNN